VIGLRGGFWPGMTGGLCTLCHLDLLRGDADQPDPEHAECVTAWETAETITRTAAQETQP
jgi:hypothetical protein